MCVTLTACRSSILDDPSTTITFVVPARSHVRLMVENSYNTVVATPIDADLGPGSHSASFDASGLQSGIYFYTLEFKALDNSSYSRISHQFLMVK
jgi:hypothetical protein